jgi:protein-tyrosine phosphatase
MIHDADQIMPRLWLGNFNSSQDTKFIRNNKIGVIINCTKDLPFLKLDYVHKYRVPVNDDLRRTEITNMARLLDNILPIIEYHYQKQTPILIHCAAGIQRSAIITLCFICIHTMCDPKTALNRIVSKRPYVFKPYMNFAQSFRMYFGEDAYQLLIRQN